MKILVASMVGDGAWAVTQLQKAGHEVEWVVDSDKHREVLTGIVPPPLDSVVDPATYDLVIFDCSSKGHIADAMLPVTPVIGNSSFADRLEHDRLFGLKFMEECGIPVPPYQEFDNPADGIRWIKASKKRTVFKPTGDLDDKATTYVSKSPDDMVRFMDVLFRKAKIQSYVLQEFMEGTEISTEAYFNGEDWFGLNHTLEEKKFMSGRVGPNTGCAGNLVWMPSRPTTLFERGLRRATDCLRNAQFQGPIDLNTIVTGGELYGLEWTPRFGYEGSCNFMQLLASDFGEFLHQIATGQSPTELPARAPFSASVRISVPPYPSVPRARDKGIPITGIDSTQLSNWYLLDARIKEGSEEELETVGVSGQIGAAIATGGSIHEAFETCEEMIKGLLVPDLQWRNDVEKCVTERYEACIAGGWLRSV